ncbi:MAG: hypothetical protein SFZ03_05290 [Candidatus Melainabacteria bacterium]|nr:hypothetical protein [Candidatus Melainabacteria bacterium]
MAGFNFFNAVVNTAVQAGATYAAYQTGGLSNAVTGSSNGSFSLDPSTSINPTSVTSNTVQKLVGDGAPPSATTLAANVGAALGNQNMTPQQLLQLSADQLPPGCGLTATDLTAVQNLVRNAGTLSDGATGVSNVPHGTLANPLQTVDSTWASVGALRFDSAA